MKKIEKKIVEKIIIESISKLKSQIEILQINAKPIAPDCSLGRLTRAEAMAEQEVNNRVLTQSKNRLTMLNNSLLRIDKEMFGICIECEEDIGIERIKIRPESVRCVDCAI